ncbi:hypothetical protein HHK36_018501 [Tetracentron sinense]|uniref:Legume lectin domain-containing protein n=1 Tax=Tetracentron sinense TaxID=13715 RepID=A0A834Z1K4_TETSI|nr:hypothetical protein HHK36_018501 [Tetracentron sinense]
MATFSISRYSLSFPFLVFYFVTLSAEPLSSFSLKRFDKNTIFESEIALFGDAEIVNGGSSVKITRSSISSAGRLMFKKPIKFVEGNPLKPVSFSTYFSFSISPGNGDGLAFIVLPNGFPLESFDGNSFGLAPELEKRGTRFLAVEFDTLMDAKLGDPNGNHVGIDIGSLTSARVSNVSSINLVLNSGEKLQSWIDYDANSKQLEVRLSKLGNIRPSNPLVSYPIDLSKLWKKEEEVFVGISSSSGNSSQTSSVYSWSFRLSRFPSWMHSQPLDPRVSSLHSKPVIVHKRSVCLKRIQTALIFGIGCGALAAFIVLFVWAIFANRRPLAPAEYPVHPVELGYEKIKVVVEKAIKDVFSCDCNLTRNGNVDGLTFILLLNGFRLDLFDGSSFGLSLGLEKRGTRVLQFNSTHQWMLGDLETMLELT